MTLNCPSVQRVLRISYGFLLMKKAVSSSLFLGKVPGGRKGIFLYQYKKNRGLNDATIQEEITTIPIAGRAYRICSFI
jgi:hypothetical protein